jgi:CYTH domain-containing protein
MNQEIEHKYLIRKDLWYAVHKPRGVNIRQGYLQTDPGKTIRIRTTGSEAFLTIKGPSRNATRAEFEYPVPPEEADDLLQLCAAPVIEKVRYRMEHAGKTWEVDEFFGENEGLILAEIELTSEEEIYERPAWIGEEVTGDPRYYNAYLALHPFFGWK